MAARADGRAGDELRPCLITTGAQTFAEGSALITVGLYYFIFDGSVE